MKTILATTSSFGQEAQGQSLQEENLQLVTNPLGRKLTDRELLELLEAHRPVGLLAGTEPITRAVLTAAKDYLRVISRVGAGWDNVDYEAATQFGIRVYRTVGVLTQAVAELTLGLMLAALRNITRHNHQLRQGVWQKRMGALLQGKIVGLIGFGAIGRRVGELTRAFGAEVIFSDPETKEVPWARRVSLLQLLQQAQIISLHASSKKRILGSAELELICRRGVILINTARGELIDEDALCSCVRDGRIAYACLDVFHQEPYQGSLCALNNVILTPHVGSYAQEARQLMEETAINNLLRGLRETKAL